MVSRYIKFGRMVPPHYGVTLMCLMCESYKIKLNSAHKLYILNTAEQLCIWHRVLAFTAKF